jgi:hypothetical protein
MGDQATMPGTVLPHGTDEKYSAEPLETLWPIDEVLMYTSIMLFVLFLSNLERIRLLLYENSVLGDRRRLANSLLFARNQQYSHEGKLAEKNHKVDRN